MTKHKYDFGMKLDEIGDMLLSGSWNVEEAKSSQIDIIPEAGLIRKIKERSLDKTVFEVFATVFMSELLKKHNELLRNADFTLYSPQAIRFEYGNQEETSRVSRIYQFFCPGMPLNKIKNAKERDYLVGQDPARIEERVTYLSGVLAEIFLKEGVIHGDPNLRHFFLLPRKGELKDVNRDDQIYTIAPRNGMGVIDVESARLEGPYSAGTKADIDKFKKRLFGRFNTPKAQEYFDKGASLVKASDFSAAQFAKELAKNIFTSRFTKVEDVDMETGKIIYR
ncbi:hypothetical protein KY338_06615 [Candidatus Woesearchaeota archaeon]|nr:hypothetical protein [Candidatus Woesearchaeota archaeon]MBW3006401.1 hypothetical protein [Candidatus Woesearchaeota archaeon]